MKRKKVIFFQYCLPDFYPPLLNKMEVFENEGWVVKTGIWNTRTLCSNFESEFPSRVIFRVHESEFRIIRLFSRLVYGIRMIAYRLGSGSCVWVFTDIKSVLFGALIAKFDKASKCVYVEYDSPGDAASFRLKLLKKCREYLCRNSELVIIPCEQRANKFNDTVKPKTKPIVVFNVPTKREISLYSPGYEVVPTKIRLHYHGSFVPARMPLSIFDAIASLPDFSITIRALTPVPDYGYLSLVKQYISEKNIGNRVEILPAISCWQGKIIPESYELGLALFSDPSIDENLASMWGASNKVFQYMEAGIVPLIYSDEPGFKSNLGDVAIFINSLETNALVDQLKSISGSIDDLKERQNKGRALVEEKYNFEYYFLPVVDSL